jgi:hypothetical protein
MDLSALSGSLSENIVRNDSSGTTLFVLKDACIIPLQQSALPDNAQYRRTRHLTIQTAGLLNALTTVLIHAFLHRRMPHMEFSDTAYQTYLLVGGFVSSIRMHVPVTF